MNPAASILIEALAPSFLVLGAAARRPAVARPARRARALGDGGRAGRPALALHVLALVLDAARAGHLARLRRRSPVRHDRDAGRRRLDHQPDVRIAPQRPVGRRRSNAAWLARQPRQPLVDVFICTYNEEQAILERTIVGALQLNVRQLARLGARRRPPRTGCATLARPARRQLSHPRRQRPRQGRQHQQRPAARRGLDQPPDFVSILDADFVPIPDFLDRTLPCSATDDVGVVQTPQHFVNPDPIQNNLSAARRLAGRAALLLRRGDGLEGRLGCRLLLRHLVGDPLSRRCGASAAFRPGR